MFSLGFSLTSTTALGRANFSPLALFTAGEQGFIYDPSDFTTLYQDNAGTTPVTAVGQTVGLVLDKSRGLVLGSELRGTGAVGLSGTATAATYNTSTGVGSAVRVDASNQSFVSIGGLSASSTYRVQITNSGPNILAIKSVSQLGAIAAAIVSGSTGTVHITGATSYYIVCAEASGTTNFTLTSFRELPGNHATQSVLASRPILQQDANGKFYLLFDGSDDFLVTPTITPGTDKAQVFAGVRKLSDAARAALVDFGGGGNGFFNIESPSNASNPDYAFRSTGTLAVNTNFANYPAPITNIVTGLGDISGDRATLRVNGAQVGQSTGDQGTGNYLAYPAYIGRRGGTLLPFNGRLYGLIARFGANLSDVQIAQTEQWLNSKTGAF